jgi:hypothetical protein
MSQYMQIDIRIIPFYEKPFSRAFPKTADFLTRVGCHQPPEKEASLYDLADSLVAASRDPAIPSGMRERVSPFVGELEVLKGKAREAFLTKRLHDLDSLLYRIEDLFEDLEGSL